MTKKTSNKSKKPGPDIWYNVFCALGTCSKHYPGPGKTEHDPRCIHAEKDKND